MWKYWNVTILIKVMVYVGLLKCDFIEKSYRLCENIQMWHVDKSYGLWENIDMWLWDPYYSLWAP